MTVKHDEGLIVEARSAETSHMRKAEYAREVATFSFQACRGCCRAWCLRALQRLARRCPQSGPAVREAVARPCMQADNVLVEGRGFEPRPCSWF